MRFQPSLMPSRTEFSATANVRQDERAPLLQPEFTDSSKICRRFRNIEPAIGRHEGRSLSVSDHLLAVDDEVGDPNAVLGSRFVLLSDQT